MKRARRAKKGILTPINALMPQVYPKQSPIDWSSVRVFGLWSSLVPETVAQNSKPILFDKGTLIVQVKNSAWIHELQFSKKDIIDKLRATLPDLKLKDVIFKLG